jgi:hypothetical protein
MTADPWDVLGEVACCAEVTRFLDEVGPEAGWPGSRAALRAGSSMFTVCPICLIEGRDPHMLTIRQAGDRYTVIPGGRQPQPGDPVIDRRSR